MLPTRFTPDRLNTLNALKRTLAPYFELETTAPRVSSPVPQLIARAHTTLHHYTFSKKLVVEQSDLNDHFFFWLAGQNVSLSFLQECFAYLTAMQASAVEARITHFRSRFVGIVLVSSPLEKELQGELKKMHRFRWLRLGFGGVSEAMLFVWQIPEGRWFGNRRGKEFEPLLKRFQQELLQEINEEE